MSSRGPGKTTQSFHTPQTCRPARSKCPNTVMFDSDDYYCVTLHNVCHLQMFTLKVLSTLALSQRESRENVEVLVGNGQEDFKGCYFSCTLSLSLSPPPPPPPSLLPVEKYIKEDGNHILAELPHVARDSTYWRCVCLTLCGLNTTYLSQSHRVSQVPRLDLDNLYEEITLDVLYHNDFRPQTANSPQKKDNSSSRYHVIVT